MKYVPFLLSVTLLLFMGTGCLELEDIDTPPPPLVPTAEEISVTTTDLTSADVSEEIVSVDTPTVPTPPPAAPIVKEPAKTVPDTTEEPAPKPRPHITPSIAVAAPTSQQVIKNPVTVAGEAVLWHFEGSFSVRVFDANDKKIGEGFVTAKTDWMVETPVPFEGTIAYDMPDTDTGYVQFVRANPSNSAAHDTFVHVPVTFFTPEPLPEVVTSTEDTVEDVLEELPTSTSPVATYEASLLQAINTYRAAAGLTALTRDDGLNQLAAAHSAYMQDVGSLSHDGFEDRFDASGFRMCVENVGWNYPTGDAMFEGWRTSPGHDANMKRAEITHIGLSQIGSYVTMFACGV